MSRTLRLVPDLTPAEKFCAVRRDMLAAWNELAKAQDIPTDDMIEEVTATKNAMLQLLGLAIANG